MSTETSFQRYSEINRYRRDRSFRFAAESVLLLASRTRNGLVIHDGHEKPSINTSRSRWHRFSLPSHLP